MSFWKVLKDTLWRYNTAGRHKCDQKPVVVDMWGDPADNMRAVYKVHCDECNTTWKGKYDEVPLSRFP